MASSPDRTARIAGRVNLSLLADSQVAVVGVGTVGSQVSRELARAELGRQILIDADLLKPENIPRHALGENYLWMNKAEGMVVYLDEELGKPDARAAALRIEDSISDDELAELFADVDLIVAATGDPRTQHRLGALALKWGIPALFPAITGPFDGEVFVQLDFDFPCFHCWHRFRGDGGGADEVTALNIDAALGIASLTTSLALGILDDSADTDLLTPEPTQDFQPQLFVISNRRLAPSKRVRKQRDCPVCGDAQRLSARSTTGDNLDLRWLDMAEVTLSSEASLSEPQGPEAPVHSHTQPSGSKGLGASGWNRTVNWSDLIGGSVFGAILMLIPSAIFVSPELHNLVAGNQNITVKLWLIVSVVLGVALAVVLELKEWVSKH